MRILWNSSTPACDSGYGIATREICRRIHDAGHFVRVATKHGYLHWHEYNGIEVFDGSRLDLLKQMITDEDFDYLITFWDIWMLPKESYPKDKWVGYIPVDAETISDKLADRAKETGVQIAMSRHGEREIRSLGLDPLYVPIGVDTSVFCPKPEAREAFRKSFGWGDDTFVIGTVGLNYPNDRKGFIELMHAFKKLHDTNPNARLYVHTHWEGKMPNTVNLRRVAADLGIDKWVAVPHQSAIDLNRIDQGWLADIYNGMDVFVLATDGEGFGMPLIEAQACGVPVIVTRTTTGPELCKTGWLIEVDGDDRQWCQNGTWRYKPCPSKILKQLRRAHSQWMSREAYAKHRSNARERVLEYDWDRVWTDYWLPVLGKLEAMTRAKKRERKVEGVTEQTTAGG